MAAPGPEAFGRGVVVDAGGPVPPAWASAPEVLVDEAALDDPRPAVDALHAAWSLRRPVVVRLAVDPARFRAPRSVAAEPWTLGADFEIPEDRLHFLVWANTYDARRDPEAPAWWWAHKAARLGASPAAGGPGDVLLRDGTPAWIDGGPRRPWPASELGAAVVHRESLERGRLAVAPEPGPPERDGLAADQHAAVAHLSGPARVVAPAGSGKTRVLTARLRHLVVDRGWEPDSVLAVAYNKKAQLELDARTDSFRPRTRTLNSLGLSVVTRAMGRPPAVLDEREVRSIVDRLAPVGRRRSNTDPIGPYIEGLSAIRLGLRDPEEVEASRDDVPGLAGLWPGFREALEERAAVDFDQQVYGAVEALLADGALRAEAQQGCRHLLVDELQDLTPAHVLMLRLLAAPVLDCFGVGDDDQVIYGHAGADPGYLIDYERRFPHAGDHPLEVNYRCPAPVVEAAVSLLSYNRRRVAKAIRAAAGATGEGGLEVLRHQPGAGAGEAARVVEGWRAAGATTSSIAVLARVNSLLLAPHVALVEAGVPVASVVGSGLLERTGLRAALAYLRIAVAPDGRIASRDLTEVLRRPSRGLPPWFSDRLRRRSAWSGGALADLIGAVPDKAAAGVERFVDDVIAVRAAAGGSSSVKLLRIVRQDIGLGGAMSLLDSGRGGEGSSHIDDLEALEAVAEMHQDPESFESWLRDRLSQPSDPAGVTVSTIHRVKGMEWDRVVVFGVNAGILPHRLAEDAEEERRVLHVGITRGRLQVVVLADRGRPSPMLEELDGTAAAPAVIPDRAPPPAVRRARPAGPGRSDPGSPGDPVVEEALRAWRRQRSTADEVPAFVVFSDRTMRAISAARPASLVALRNVEGIGPTKLELYGDEILAVVAEAGPAGEGGDPREPTAGGR